MSGSTPTNFGLTGLAGAHVSTGPRKGPVLILGEVPFDVYIVCHIGGATMTHVQDYDHGLETHQSCNVTSQVQRLFMPTLHRTYGER
eukprot:8189765-Karenia_brevis.AAC.1